MIGRYLDTLTPTQEDGPLTTPMVGNPAKDSDQVCLVMATHGLAFNDEPLNTLAWSRWRDSQADDLQQVPWCYDALTDRFGETRVNQAIRARILRNRVRRALTAPLPEYATP